MPKCPICGEELIEEPTTWVGGCTAETYAQCPEQHYYDGSAYGNSHYLIGAPATGWTYAASKEYKKDIRNNIDKAIRDLNKNKD